ncbi:MAG: MnhB domain-containing protein [Eubacteriales bacterium]|nr:MnhB domain-containing protein [Eubacteriales bacterium]
MSRKISEEQYKRNLSVRFKKWISGETDPYLGNMEITPKKEYAPDEKILRKHMADQTRIISRTYDMEHNRVYRFFNWFYRKAAFLCCIVLIAILILTVSYLPKTTDPGSPGNNEVAERYITQGMQETGAVNAVTGMILTYRAFDTFGETNVLFVATCCVMILLMLEEGTKKKAEDENDARYEPKKDVILQTIAGVLCPIIFIFGIYVILNGHLSPGGGFSGGAIMGAGMILYVSAFGFKKTQKFFNEEVYKVAKISALCVYGLIGSYYYITGANGIENHIPLGIPGHILSSGIILPINIAVGLEVACTMYAFYALFRKGGL